MKIKKQKPPSAQQEAEEFLYKFLVEPEQKPTKEEIEAKMNEAEDNWRKAQTPHDSIKWEYINLKLKHHSLTMKKAA